MQQAHVYIVLSTFKFKYYGNDMLRHPKSFILRFIFPHSHVYTHCRAHYWYQSLIQIATQPSLLWVLKESATSWHDIDTTLTRLSARWSEGVNMLKEVTYLCLVSMYSWAVLLYSKYRLEIISFTIKLNSVTPERGLNVRKMSRSFLKAQQKKKGLKWKFLENQRTPRNESKENYQRARWRFARFTNNAEISTQKDKFLN